MSSTKPRKPGESTELVPVHSAPSTSAGPSEPVAPPHPMLLQRYRDSWKEADSRRPSRAEAEAAVETLLRWIGEDPTREGLRETPSRVAKAYEEIFGGYRLDAGDVLGRTFEDVSGYDDMVLVKDISFHTHCEHHMVPVIGKAHVGYMPDDRVLGLSKIARLVDIYGRRLQTQESMTAQIAAAIVGVLQPRGVAVMIEAEHLCMSMRGIRSKGSTTITTTFEGAFERDAELRRRFLALCGERRGS